LGKIVNYVDSSTLAGAAKPKKNERSCPGNSYLHKNQNVSRGCMSRHRTSGLFFVPAAFARSDFYKGSEGVSTKTRYPSMAISRTASTMMENSMRNAFQLGSIARTKRSSDLYHMKRYSFGRGQRCFFSSPACAEHLPPRPGRRSAGSHKTGTTTAASLLTSCRILGTISATTETENTWQYQGAVWLPFLDTYRTMCPAPQPEFREVLEQVRSLLLAA
jgi:hypothetical protein